MIILPVGTTGFGNASLRENVSLFQGEKIFKAECYEVARIFESKVDRFEKPSQVCNYRLCVLQMMPSSKNVKVTILCNDVYAMLAFSITEEIPFEFIDAPQLSSAFESLGYVVLSKSFLESYPTALAIKNLSSSEMKEYRYWKPIRIGDIIFNWWDWSLTSDSSRLCTAYSWTATQLQRYVA